MGKRERRKARTWLLSWNVGGREMRCLVIGQRSPIRAVRVAAREFGAQEPVKAMLLGEDVLGRTRDSGAD
jgi:hypothetical protein